MPLRLLLVEDDHDDAALLLRELRRAGYEPDSERVDTPDGLVDALERGGWDLVISDYVMPRFSGTDALRLVRERATDLPFIIVSGTIGEDTAVEAMRSGADDYLMKGRLARLAPAIERELHEAALRQAHRVSEMAVDRRDAMLDVLVRSAERLLRAHDVGAVIPAVLGDLGRALEMSRIYVFENHRGEDGELLTSHRYEWTALGVASEAGNPLLRSLPVRAGGFGRWAQALSAGETVHGLVRDMPAAEREFLEALGVLSFASVPIFVGGEWWGMLGFDDCAQEREWSAAEVHVLRAAADTLGAALERARVQRQVDLQLQRLAGLRAVNTATNASLDVRVTLNVLLDHATSQLGVDAATVLLHRARGSMLEYGAARGFRTGALRYTSLKPGEGLAGRVALERRPLSIPDLRRERGSLSRSPAIEEEGFVSYYALPLLAKGAIKGVLELFHRAPLEPSAEWLDFAHTLAGQAAVAIDNALLFEDLQISNTDLVLAYDSTLEGWSRALDLRDRETEGHTQRVTRLTVRLAAAMGMTGDELVYVRRGALLHDIGKMGIPDGILLKPGPLTEEEWKVMRLHPVYAHDLLSPIAYLRPALDIPYCHHERWDGTGYPRGLAGESIPLEARAFAVADVWDALRSDRPYRAAWEEGRTVEHIRAGAGTHFDPRIVDVFLSEIVEGERRTGRASDPARTATTVGPA